MGSPRWPVWMGMVPLLLHAAGLSAGDVEGERPEWEGAVVVDEVVISATRTEIPVFDAAQSVSIVSTQDIMNQPFDRLEDALRFAVGVENHSHYGWQTGGVASHLSMRGTGRNRILMMLDGVPLNDLYNNSIAWVAWGLIPRQAIGRLEVVRGPSGLYGSDGLGGAINIVTQAPPDTDEISVRARFGSGATYAGGAMYGSTRKPFGWLIAAEYEDSDGFFMVDPEEDYTIERYRKVGKGLAKLTYELDARTQAYLTGLYYHHEMGKGREYFYDTLDLMQSRMGFTHRRESTQWSGFLYYNHANKVAYQDLAADNYTSLDRKERFPANYTWGAELQNTTQLPGDAALTAGMTWKHVAMDYEEDYRVVDRDAGASGRQMGVGPFASLETRLLDDKLIATASGRFDWLRNFDGAGWDDQPPGTDPYDDTYGARSWSRFSPRLGLVYQPDNLTALRGSLGSGFRAPSLFELYKLHVRQGGRSLRYPNPDLGPEKIITLDFGAERFITENLWSRVTLYQSWATDYIGVRTLHQEVDDRGRTWIQSQLDNITELEIRGLEGEVEWRIQPDLRTTVRYTYNLSEIVADQEDHSLKGKQLPGDPRHKLRTGLTYGQPHYFTVSLFLRQNWKKYRDSLNTEYLPDERFLDLSLSTRLGDRFTARLDVENLVDDDSIIREGRIYYASVQMDLQR